METILKTENLTKQYRRVCAVDRVSLTIEKGDIFGFIGENGAGKTTFMRMVCGLIRPTDGTLELFGRTSEKEVSQARKKMGALIEHPAVYTGMSAMENLEVQRRCMCGFDIQTILDHRVDTCRRCRGGELAVYGRNCFADKKFNKTL